MKRAIFWLLVIFGFSVAWIRPGHADPLAPMDAFTHAKAEGFLPTWATPFSPVRLVSVISQRRIYLCMSNHDGTKHWTTWGTWTGYASVITTGQYLFDSETQPTTAADERVCWPATGPVATGEPAYLNLVCPDGCSDGKRLDYAQMNQPDNIAGSTVKGEPCGEDTGMGFYALPRLHTGNVVPVTRCQP